MEKVPLPSSSVHPATASPRRPRRSWPQRCLIACNCSLITLCLTAASLVGYSYYRFGAIPRLALDDVLADEPPGRPENFLLVGSDSRDFVEGGDDDERTFGDRTETGPPKADTVILVRIDPEAQTAAMASFPRDLWLPIAGTGDHQRINTALEGGPTRLIETVLQNFDVPVHHYIQVDFEGFRGVVDAAGGVDLFLDAPVRDYDAETQSSPSGLGIDQTGCVRLDGEQALAYVRSRHFQRFVDGRWQADTSGDLGRIDRQQDFVSRAVRKALAGGLTNPKTLTDLLGVAGDNVAFDDDLDAADIVRLGRRFQTLGAASLQASTLPTAAGRTDGGAAVQFLEEDQAEEILDVFRGVDRSQDQRPVSSGAPDTPVRSPTTVTEVKPGDQQPVPVPC